MRRKTNNRKRQGGFLVPEKRELKKSNTDGSLLSFSFAQLDTSQGQDFDDLLKNKLAKVFFDRLCQYSKWTFHEANESKAFKFYPNFPPPDKTNFKHPRHVEEGVNWVSFRLGAKPRVIGHFIKSTLFIIFIDCHHTFWRSDKKHTKSSAFRLGMRHGVSSRFHSR